MSPDARSLLVTTVTVTVPAELLALFTCPILLVEPPLSVHVNKQPTIRAAILSLHPVNVNVLVDA